jgi:hypothetical protein
MKRQRAMLFVALVIAAGTLVLARDIRVKPNVSEGRVLVFFTARDSWTQSARDVLQAGVPLTFDYEIVLKKPGTFWFLDSVFARLRISTQAQFDTLRRKYSVKRLRNGVIVKVDEREFEADVRDWLTDVERIELDPVTPLEVNVDYYVHVTLSTSPRLNFSLLSLLPFAHPENVGSAKVTYIK